MAAIASAQALVVRMKRRCASSPPLRFYAFACLLVAVLPFLSAEGPAGNPAKAEPLPKDSASRVIRRQDDDADRHRRGLRNRINPKRRTGKEGTAEAKIETELARELYIRRKARLEEINAEQRELSKDNVTLAKKRARMQARRIEAVRALKLSERRLTEIEAKLAGTRAKVQELRANLDQRSDQMSALFALMQGMSREPPPLLITHTRDALKMIRSGMVFATFYGDIEKLAAELSEQVKTLEAAQQEAENQEQRRKAEQGRNIRLKSQIELLLAENRNSLEVNAASLANLKSSSKINTAGLKSLEEMIPALDPAAPPGVPASEENKNEPSGSKLALAHPGVMQASIPFANSQGLLPLPVQGKILVRFGQPDPDGAPSKGMYIETRQDAQVISPCDGLILYAGPFRSYGQLLIINPGGGYHVVIAGMDRIDAQQGQYVLAGEPIAAMSSATHTGERSVKRPTLYVEFRRDQQSIDPGPWWSLGGRG